MAKKHKKKKPSAKKQYEKRPGKKPAPDKRTLKRLAATALTLAYELPVHGDWLGNEEIDKIENDATVLSAVSIRKSTTLQKELILSADDDEVVRQLERVLGYTFRSQVLDTVLQGLSVFELNWHASGFYYYPRPVERDYRLFSIKGETLYFDQQSVDEFKAVWLTSRAKFNAPLGRPLYDTLFWLRRFKAASLEFWVEFLERFGHPWVIGKTDGDKDEMAEELYAMLGGDVAVLEGEDSIDLKLPSDKGAFREIVTYIDDQIREAIVGGNLTGNVQGGSYAAAQVHKEVSDDIAMADARILHEAVAAMIDRFVRLNRIDGMRIEFRIKDRDDPRSELAERDAKLAQAFGDAYRFDREYLENTYGIRLVDAATAPVAARRWSFSTALPADRLDRFVRDLDTSADEEAIAETLERIFADASSYEEAFERLRDAFGDLDEAKLLQTFDDFVQKSMIYGAAEAELEEREES
jgi:phage gp29-like protein